MGSGVTRSSPSVPKGYRAGKPKRDASDLGRQRASARPAALFGFVLPCVGSRVRLSDGAFLVPEPAATSFFFFFKLLLARQNGRGNFWLLVVLLLVDKTSRGVTSWCEYVCANRRQARRFRIPDEREVGGRLQTDTAGACAHVTLMGDRVKPVHDGRFPISNREMVGARSCATHA